MLIWNGTTWEPFYKPVSKTPAVLINLERAWVNARNFSVKEFNSTVEAARTRYGRMMDVPYLEPIEMPAWCNTKKS